MTTAPPPPDPVIAQLGVLAQAIQDAKKTSNFPALDNDLTNVQRAIAKVALKQYPEAVTLIQSIIPPTTDPNDPVAIALQNLNTAFNDSSDAYHKEMTKMLTDSLDQATNAIKSATKSSDLDPIILNLAACEDRLERKDYDIFNQSIRQKLEGAISYTDRFQMVLSDEENGNITASADCFELLKSTSFVPLTHAEILALAPKADAIAGRIMFAQLRFQTIGDIPTAYQLMDSLRLSGLPFNDEATGTLMHLGTLAQAYEMYKEQAYQAGLGTLRDLAGSEENATYGHSEFPIPSVIFNKVMEQLKIRMIIGYIDDPSLPTPRPGDSGTVYLQNSLQALVRSENWGALQRAIQLNAAENENTDWAREDVSAIQYFLQGQKYEEVRDYFSAKGCYQNAMQASGKYFPSNVAASKLKQLQDSYPDNK